MLRFLALCAGHLAASFCMTTAAFTTRLAPIAPAEGCARWNEINIRPDCGSPRTVQASDCSAPASRPSFSGELILLSFTHVGPLQKASYDNIQHRRTEEHIAEHKSREKKVDRLGAQEHTEGWCRTYRPEEF